MDKTGYVYILTNPSFKEDWIKIGKSYRPVDIRSKELDNTAVPLPFEIFATIKTVKYNEVEKLIHKTIDRLTDLRIRQNREFFNVAPQVALDLIRDIALTIDDAVIDEYNNGFSSNEDDTEYNTMSSKPRTRFKFSMIGIPIGATVVFTPTNLEVKVASDDQVEYDNRLYKLSPFVGTFMPENRRNTSGVYQGAKYFTYNDDVLADLRDKSDYDFYDSDCSSRNYDKYNFKGNTYNKSELVSAVIKEYVLMNCPMSYSELERVFPRHLQGSCGCFDRKTVAENIYTTTKRKRHRLNSNDIILLSDDEIAVSSQWGQGNIHNFISASISKGFKIKVL